MMSSTAGSREKLLDVFYGIYRQDSAQVIQALIDLKIIVPTADMLSIRRSMQYFLKNFQQATQREETIGAIGEDLFAIALDQPFRFPATFTFVLRAFSTLEGLGKALDPNYSFSEVAKPYALELLNLQDVQQAQGFVLERLQQQAVQVGSDAAAMPGRVAAIDSTLGQLEAGELKLRTRVLESERADRRQAVLQLATVNAIAVAGLANMATQFGLNGHPNLAWGSSLTAGVFAFFVWRGFRRIKRLDKFEKDIRM
jgi:predicted unusual protein kinase regulating ubiquinone biosynthesis (AarF/ABC1/UbiB family)